MNNTGQHILSCEHPLFITGSPAKRQITCYSSMYPHGKKRVHLNAVPLLLKIFLSKGHDIMNMACNIRYLLMLFVICLISIISMWSFWALRQGQIVNSKECELYIVSVLGWDKGYTVKYNPLLEGVPGGEAQGNYWIQMVIFDRISRVKS